LCVMDMDGARQNSMRGSPKNNDISTLSRSHSFYSTHGLTFSASSPW
jgi:hypothetical protein